MPVLLQQTALAQGETADSLIDPTTIGPYTVAAYDSGLTGNDGTVGDYRVFYPSDKSGVLGAHIWVGGSGNDITEAPETGPTGYMASDNYELQYFLASHGWIAMAINMGSAGIYANPGPRATALLMAADMLAAEHTRSASPLYGKVATTNMMACGHSFGAGGSWIATADTGNTRFVGSWQINSVAGTDGDATDITLPALFISGENGTPDGSSSYYSSIGGSVPKVLAQFKDTSSTETLYMHDVCRAPIATLWTGGGSGIASGTLVSNRHSYDEYFCSLLFAWSKLVLDSDNSYLSLIANNTTYLNTFSSANLS